MRFLVWALGLTMVCVGSALLFDECCAWGIIALAGLALMAGPPGPRNRGDNGGGGDDPTPEPDIPPGISRRILPDWDHSKN